MLNETLLWIVRLVWRSIVALLTMMIIFAIVTGVWLPGVIAAGGLLYYVVLRRRATESAKTR